MHQFGIIKKCLDTVDARCKHEECQDLLDKDLSGSGYGRVTDFCEPLIAVSSP